ncbi:hypothetical protein LRAMOSA03292 [Lichtheimia ramosa]|uniref:Uncharacterized protein n=1 Tax=Lichtheimia ramosa TaxID=688394 RepID=A0A077WVK9_9FUNG|nr:hypothetical protein LRAMOSA03292 [Lichtheimia ramosa]
MDLHLVRVPIDDTITPSPQQNAKPSRRTIALITASKGLDGRSIEARRRSAEKASRSHYRGML